MNMWLKKKSVWYGTWNHPATRVSHMIDLVMMRMDQQMYCKDVSVMGRANCWSDHKLVNTKMRFKVLQHMLAVLAVGFLFTNGHWLVTGMLM